jgi:DNA-nicking Smr family endonuclease
MKYEIDLHGFTHDEAVFTVEDVLIKESMKSERVDVTIITGHSPKLQDRIIHDVLERHGFNYYIPGWNTGQIIVN